MDDFKAYIGEAAQKLLSLQDARATILHHNDADGLSSGSIITRSLTRANFNLYRYCLEKPYPEVIKRILDEPGGPILLVDFGSGMIKILSNLNKRSREIFLLDHHALDGTSDVKVSVVNPIRFGIDGSSECTASVVAYLFAMALDPLNQDLLPIALIGSVGDGHLSSEKEPKALHKKLFDEAHKLGVLKREKDGEIFLKSGENWIEAKKIAHALNSLGSFGYFSGGTDSALKGLEEGFDARYFTLADFFSAKFEDRFKAIKDSIKITKSGSKLSWFDLRDSLQSFGVKSVGLICERFLSEGIVDSNGVLIGFQHIPPSIPGLGTVIEGETKLSVRLGSELTTAAEGNRDLRVSSFLPRAIEKVGGFVDACHKHAGAATVKIGNEMNLISAIEAIL